MPEAMMKSGSLVINKMESRRKWVGEVVKCRWSERVRVKELLLGRR
jgi:hypothetical protein